MKALLLTPTAFPSLTGNAVTAHRISLQLARGGVSCTVIDCSRRAGPTLADEAAADRPDVIHALHAYRSGRWGLDLKGRLAVPLIVTLTGTDLYADLSAPVRRGVVREVLDQADAITVFNPQAQGLLANHGIDPARVAVIHQSVFLPRSKPVDFRHELGIGRDMAVFLMLGAIRRIKNIPEACDALESVRAIRPRVHLVVAGPVLDPSEFRRIRSWADTRPWVTCLGEVPRASVRALMGCADFVLNTSASESEPNTLLEAMSCGRIVIARHIPGNASLVTDRTGLAFDGTEDLREKMVHAIDHREDLQAMGRRARSHVRRHFGFRREMNAYLDLYGRFAPVENGQGLC